MAFVLGLVVGIIVGFGIIAGFVKSENSRSKFRPELATTIAAFAKMTVEDSRKIFPPEYYPSWVVFSQRQKLSTRFLEWFYPLLFSFFYGPNISGFCLFFAVELA